jgi:membrane-associated phospholipid phosphatase
VRRSVAATSFVGFIVLAVLVEHGTFASLDQHAVDHWMPWLHPGHGGILSLRGLVVPQTESTLGGTLVALWTYPASLFASALVVGAIAWRLRSVALAALYVAANAVELGGKLIVHRPPLYAHGIHLSGLDHGLPSGHTMRSLVVATAIAALGRWGRFAYAWALGVAVALVLIGDHTPTDVVAGGLAFLALRKGV